MDFKDLQKPLPLESIDFRVQSINKGGYATVLAYKDARVDMKRLDEVVGIEGWKKDYKIIEGRLYCGVAIKHDGEWIWKWDVGTESNTEAEKGQASDAFKRACFNLGIGRELYDFPLIQIKLNDDEFTTDNNGRAKATWKLQIRDWSWGIKQLPDGRVAQLAAKDKAGKVRFNFKDEELLKEIPKKGDK